VSRALLAALASAGLLCLAAAGAAPSGSSAGKAHAPLQAERVHAGQVDAARIAAADSEPGQWLTHGRSYDEQRFSPLRQIHTGNVVALGPAWSFMTGTKRGLEATPIVVDGVLYATGTWSVVYALDAASGRLLWRYDPEVPRWKGRDACCDVVNRGVAVWKGRVYLGTLDGRLVALDAATGKPVWQVRTTPLEQSYTITGAPRIVKGLVIIGNGGAEFGVRGYFGAYDAATGALRWRFYTVPASKEGPFEQPSLAKAAETWPANSLWKSGLGGTVWDSMAYDPELDLLYVGVGNASVYDRQIRSPGGGDNLFLASILAVRPETGRLVWYYQTTPGEQWDYTATQHMILADLTIHGRLRKVLMQAPKNGFFYVLDRKTGELLSARNYVPVSWASGVDLATGRPVERPEASWSRHPAVVEPAVVGGHSWHPMSFDPETGLVYIPAIEEAYSYRPDPDFHLKPPGHFNTGEDFAGTLAQFEGLEDLQLAACDPTRLLAWDPVRQRKVWEVRHSSGVPAGVLSTAGGLVFQGSGDGVFSAYDARSGEKLWSSKVGIGIMAAPVSYRVNGVQYVAVLAGVGGSSGTHFTRFHYVNDGRLIAWKLGGRAALPPVQQRPTPHVEAPRMKLSAASVKRGRTSYARYCMRCHGAGVKSSGLYPDLRYASRATHAQWQEIVLGGARVAGGMASFADVLTLKQAREIQAYVIARALHEPSLLEQAASWFAQHACLPAEWMTD